MRRTDKALKCKVPTVKSDKGRKRLVFFDCITHFGGSGQVTVRTIEQMQEWCDIVVLDAYGVCREYHQALKHAGINSVVLLSGSKHHCIGGENLLSRFGRVLAGGYEMVKVIRQLSKQLDAIRPDAVWTTSHKGFFFLSHAAGKNVPMVFFAHGEKSFPRWYNRSAWKRVPLVAGVCKGSFARLRGSRYEPPMMEVIYNGIDIDETVRRSSQLSAELPATEGTRLLLPGSLTENKNQSTAIRGLAEFLDHGGRGDLLLAGDFTPGTFDGYARSLPVLARDLGVSDRIHFLGWRDDIIAVIARCDVVVLTSYSEGLPMVLLEAMCLNKPVIATRVGGIPELVRDEIDGFLIQPGDYKAFAQAVAKLTDADRREKMGRQGFERVKSCFDIRVTASRFLEAINGIC